MARRRDVERTRAGARRRTRARALRRRHALQRGRRRSTSCTRGSTAALEALGRAVRDPLRRRRLDRRHVRRARAAPRRPTRACARSASSGTSASTPRCTPGSARARGDDRRDDGRRPPEPARGHPAARRGGRGGLRRRERPARRAPRLVGPHAALAADQRDAAPLHGRRHLRLRLRVQRLPARRGRADARRDRPAEVHEGARPLRRRVRRRGRRRPRAPRRRLALLAAPADAARAPRARRLLAAADPVGRRRARHRLLARRRSRSAIYGLVYWITNVGLPRARCSSARSSSSCSASRASSSPSSASTSAESSASWSTPSTVDREL